MSQITDLTTVPSLTSVNHSQYLAADDHVEAAKKALAADNFRDAVQAAFNLPQKDDYVYHAVASVTLDQVQTAVNAGVAHGLCDWYTDEHGKSVCARLL